MAVKSIIPKQGERALIVGQTGSGKTEFAMWLLERLPNSPIVIYDTKGEPGFSKLPRSIAVTSSAGVQQYLDVPELDYIVFKIPPELVADSEALDSLLLHHFYNYQGTDVYVDELFSFSQNGRAGPGLVALLTQGRSKGITTIMSAQRPSWLSRFAISETQRYYIFRLVDSKDRARLGDVIPEFASSTNPPEYQFYYYRAGEETFSLQARISLDKHGKKADDSTLQDLDHPDTGTSLNWI